MENVDQDWVDNDALSADETLARFRALRPEKTAGPARPLYQISTRHDSVRSIGGNAVQATPQSFALV